MNKTAENFDEVHRSVLLNETIDYLNIGGGGNYIDATLGLGGHTNAILEKSETATVLGIDQDADALKIAKRRLEKFGSRARFAQGNFSSIKEISEGIEIEEVDGIIADLGVSSLQLDSETRGFSFRFDAPLDMRMDAESDFETAADLLQRLSETEIANLIFEYGEERFSRRIARRIVERRLNGDPIETTKELARLIERAVPGKRDRIHPATKTFQALRIAVNGELAILEDFLRDCVSLLKKDGRLVVITFHSLEDRIVKHTFQRLSGRCVCPPKFPKCVCGAEKTLEILTKKPIVPSDTEQNDNPRARSAKLRAARKS